MNYQYRENLMNRFLERYQSPTGFRSTFKAVPIALYDEVKSTIDFTKYYVMFRGPRNRGDSSTRKRNAKAFDVYQRSARDTERLRIEREAFWRGVNWARSN
jgi:hypothetical protein